MLTRTINSHWCRPSLEMQKMLARWIRQNAARCKYVQKLNVTSHPPKMIVQIAHAASGHLTDLIFLYHAFNNVIEHGIINMQHKSSHTEWTRVLFNMQAQYQKQMTLTSQNCTCNCEQRYMLFDKTCLMKTPAKLLAVFRSPLNHHHWIPWLILNWAKMIISFNNSAPCNSLLRQLFLSASFWCKLKC